MDIDFELDDFADLDDLECDWDDLSGGREDPPSSWELQQQQLEQTQIHIIPLLTMETVNKEANTLMALLPIDFLAA